MGFYAAGVSEVLTDSQPLIDWEKGPWPWLVGNFSVPLIVKNSTTEPTLFRHVKNQYESLGYSIISFLAYMVKSGEISLEQAVDWIRSVEPEEPKTEAELNAEWKQELVEMST
jgi:hypothetical protein